MTVFSDPTTTGDRLPPRELIGHLLIVRPTEYINSMSTVYGDTDAVVVDVVDLDDTDPDTGGTGRVHNSVLWFSGRIVGALKRQLGEFVLARMGVGTGKPGQSPPFVLEAATDDPAAVTRAQAWMSAHPNLNQPTTTAAKPTVPAVAPTEPTTESTATPTAPSAQIPPSALAVLSPEQVKSIQALLANQQQSG